MQVLGAGSRGCRREFRTPAIHPGAAARKAGSGCSAVPRRCGAHVPVFFVVIIYCSRAWACRFKGCRGSMFITYKMKTICQLEKKKERKKWI
jgi:hypothetical protein